MLLWDEGIRSISIHIRSSLVKELTFVIFYSILSMLVWRLEVHLCSMGWLYIVMLITWACRSLVRWSTTRACSLTWNLRLIGLCFGLDLSYVWLGVTVVHLTHSAVRGIGLLVEAWGINLHVRRRRNLLRFSTRWALGLSTSNHIWHFDRSISEWWENRFWMWILLIPILMSRYRS